MKAEEVAQNLAGTIKEAVKNEVNVQLGLTLYTVLDLIDRVVKLEAANESNSTNRQEGTEGPNLSGPPEVVSKTIDETNDPPS